MLTRKIRQSSTPNQKIRETQKKIKLMPNPISKRKIRNLIKGRLGGKHSRRDEVAQLKKWTQGSERRASLLELIDNSKCECPICLQIAISPILLPCGHCYCLKCFEENSIFNLRCCLCRLQINAEEILPASMIQNFIDRFILPTSSEQISYWCRQGEFSEWETRRRIDLQSVRVEDNIDVRTDDNNWRRGVIVSFQFHHHQCRLQIKYFLNGKIETTQVPAHSRRLAPNGFFTKGQYLKYRTVCYESKFVESIEIPEIRCDFADESAEMMVREDKCNQESIHERQNGDLALELFQYEMKEWDNVFQLS